MSKYPERGIGLGASSSSSAIECSCAANGGPNPAYPAGAPARDRSGPRGRKAGRRSPHRERGGGDELGEGAAEALVALGGVGDGLRQRRELRPHGGVIAGGALGDPPGLGEQCLV